MPSNSKKGNETGINAFRIYLAGSAPASGEPCLYKNEIQTNCRVESIPTTQNGIKKLLHRLD